MRSKPRSKPGDQTQEISSHSLKLHILSTTLAAQQLFTPTVTMKRNKGFTAPHHNNYCSSAIVEPRGESPTPAFLLGRLGTEFKGNTKLSRMDVISYGFALIVLSGGVMGYMKAGKDSV